MSILIKETTQGSNVGQSVLRVGVIGYGYWGPNVLRNFYNTPGVHIGAVCDINPQSLERVAQTYPAIPVTQNVDDILTSPDIDAVVIVVPLSHHFSLAKRALENGKHVFVEKPFTQTACEAEQLIELAERKNLMIMVDHTFVFNGAVRKIRELIDDGTLGTLYYYDSTRINLGLIQHDSNVVWDLAPHDFSIIDYLIGQAPEALVATGENHVNGVEDVAFVTIYFPSKVIAHVNVSWLSPVKVRTTLIGGEKKMIMWNDLEADEKIKVYDKGIEPAKRGPNGDHQLRISYRAGDLWSPRISTVEALQLETRHFVDCIMKNQVPLNDGKSGLRVVRMLEAVDRSLSQRGGMVYL